LYLIKEAGPASKMAYQVGIEEPMNLHVYLASYRLHTLRGLYWGLFS